MQEEEKKQEKFQKKSHETLLKILNNVGIIGSILAAISDIIFVIIFTLGFTLKVDIKYSIMFSCIHGAIGIIINTLLRYQGQKYAEIENEELLSKFYRKEVKEKKYISMKQWTVTKIIIDILIKGLSISFVCFGLIYISIQGSHEPVHILISLATLSMFVCFGLVSMNSSYTRYYNVQVPYMEMKLKEKQENEEEQKNINQKEENKKELEEIKNGID